MSGELDALVSTLGGTNVESEAGTVEFDYHDAFVTAIVKDGAARLQIWAELAIARKSLVESWVRMQPPPRSGRLEVVTYEEGEVAPMLVFERPAEGNDWQTDPLGTEVRTYSDSWRDRSTVVSNGMTYTVKDDPRDLTPSSGWLLLGSEASYPDPQHLNDLQFDADRGIFDRVMWTAAKQTILGDLALVYFTSPHKAVHFITRAASDAFFRRDISVNASGGVADEQHWAYFTPLIEIEPIPYSTLQQAADGHLILQGRSGRFLRPEVIASLPIRAMHSRDQPELDRVLSTPVGLADLPDPADIDIETWSAIAAGALPLEAHVSSHIVEPLLHHVLKGTGLQWHREYRVRSGSVDFVVTNSAGTPTAAIEVKLATAIPPSQEWTRSKDFLQLRRYTDELSVPGILIDAHRILLVEDRAMQPHREISRRWATADDIAAVRRHVVS